MGHKKQTPGLAGSGADAKTTLQPAFCKDRHVVVRTAHTKAGV